MTGFTQLGYQRRGPAAWITLNRPARRNALTPVMLAEAHQTLDRADADDEVRVLVLTGAPPAFCAGADLSFFQAMVNEPDGCDRFLAGVIEPLAQLMARLRGSARPVVAAVNGACAAGGLELILACDLVVAAADATFTDAHSRLGIAPAVGAAAALERRTTELAATLSERSPVSVAAMKAMVHRALQPSWERTLESDLAFFRQNWASPALREGLAAQAGRRPPRFTQP